MPYPSYRHPSPHYRTPGRSVALLGSSVLTELQFLQATWGDALLPAAYSSKYSSGSTVTRTGSDVSGWTDIRGGGFGPAFADPGAGNRPPWDAANLRIGPADGVAHFLETAVSSLLALDGARTLIVAGYSATSAGDGGYLASIADSSAANRLMALHVNAGSKIIGTHFPGGTTIDTTVDAGATVKLQYVAKDAGTNGYARASSAAEQTGAITAIPAGNNSLTCFAFHSGSAARFVGVVSGILVLGRKATAQDYTDLTTWFNTYHA